MTYRTVSLLALALAVSGCFGNNSGNGAANNAVGNTVAGGGSLPIAATGFSNGRVLAVRLPSTNTFTAATNQVSAQYRNEPTSVTATDRTPAGGVGFQFSAEANPNATQPFAPDLIDAEAEAGMAGGAEIEPLVDAEGRVFFQDGNFGDPQGSTDQASISTVGVFNLFDNNFNLIDTIVLKDSTTVRYYAGGVNETDGAFAVGFVGNPTASMPTQGQATYTSFYEGGINYFDNGGTPRSFSLRGDASLSADFAANTVSGGIENLTINVNDNGTLREIGGTQDALAIAGTISGSDFNGTADFVNAADAKVGTTTNNEMIGGFFGADAGEAIAAFSIEGTMALDGQDRDFVSQGVIGGRKN